MAAGNFKMLLLTLVGKTQAGATTTPRSGRPAAGAENMLDWCAWEAATANRLVDPGATDGESLRVPREGPALPMVGLFAESRYRMLAGIQSQRTTSRTRDTETPCKRDRLPAFRRLPA